MNVLLIFISLLSFSQAPVIIDVMICKCNPLYIKI